MLTVHVVLIIVSMIFTLASLIMYTIDEEDDICTLVSFIIATALFGFYMFGCKQLKETPWNYPDEPYAVEEIAALSDNNMTNGKFYMRSGYIESDLYYQYIVELNSGGYKTKKIKADTATIFYDDDNCRVEWYEKTRSWLYWSESEVYKQVYIPEGSLTDTYSIDLQ